MSNTKKVITWILAMTITITSVSINQNSVQAFTQPLVTNSGITYPISLETGKDAKEKLVFPDADFLEYVSNATFQSGNYYGKKFDLNHDGMLSEDECELVRIISVGGKSNIKSLAGVEAFPKLRELYCNDTGITELNLSNNPRLQILSCASTKVRELDLSTCTILKELKFSGCSIGAIDLTTNSALEYLVCSNQDIDTYEYQNEGKYCVSLEDVNRSLDLSRVSNVKIDGAYGDDINSGYDSDKGLVWCSDEMQSVTYTYKLDLKDKTDAMDEYLYVTLNLKNGIRESYDSQGGSKVLTQFVEEGMADKEPEHPTKTGCIFTGWYTDTSCTLDSKWSFAQQITDNIVLYAGWENKAYKVIYKNDGVQIKERSADWWTKNLISDVAVQKTGYLLKGWKTETGMMISNANNHQITYGQASGNDADTVTVLLAVWQPKDGYQLKLSSNLTKRLKRDMLPGDRIRLDGENAFHWEQKKLVGKLKKGNVAGYTFKGWYTKKKGGKKITNETDYGEIFSSSFAGDNQNNIPTIYAVYEKTRYTVNYNTRGGSYIKSRKNVKWGSKVPIPKKKPKKRGYIFKGWKLEGKKVTKKSRLNDKESFYCWKKRVTLKAVWKKVRKVRLR